MPMPEQGPPTRIDHALARIELAEFDAIAASVRKAVEQFQRGLLTEYDLLDEMVRLSGERAKEG